MKFTKVLMVLSSIVTIGLLVRRFATSGTPTETPESEA